MRQFPRRISQTIVLTVVIATIGLPIVSASVQNSFFAPATRIEMPSAEVFDDALDLALSADCSSDEQSGAAVRWTVCGRILPPYSSDSEYRFFLSQYSDGKVVASITRPTSLSVRAQLDSLNKQHPAFSARELAKLVKSNVRTFNQTQLPDLKRLANEFEGMDFSPTLEGDLVMDPTTYEVHSRSLYGNQMVVIIRGPGSGAPKQPHPLLTWAEDLKRLLEGAAH